MRRDPVALGKRWALFVYWTAPNEYMEMWAREGTELAYALETRYGAPVAHRSDAPFVRSIGVAFGEA